LAAACAVHTQLGPASLVLYDVSTLHFETDAGDGFREPGFSKERRLDPQITIGLLTDAAGSPLMVNAFEGTTAETTTMVPTIKAFMQAHQLPDVTVVADAGMISAANQQAIEAAGLSFILGVSRQRRDQVIYYQYQADRARRSLRGIDEQIAKAERAVAGKAAIKRNRFIQLSGGTRTVNRTLGDQGPRPGRPEGLRHQPRHLPRRHPRDRGVRHRRLPPAVPDRTIVPDVQTHDLQARPIYHHHRDSIEAHLTTVFAALAVSRWIENRTGWSIKKFVRTARRYRTIEIQAGTHTITAADPLPDDLRQALEAITRASRGAH
jgi:hypothetical protein